MAKITLNRRSLLRGATGAAIALPALHIMGEARAASPPPKRLVIFGAGGLASVGFSRDQNPDGHKDRDMFNPVDVGPNYTPSYTLAEAFKEDPSVRSDVSVVSGLTIPVGTAAPNRDEYFHGSTIIPQIAGQFGQGYSSFPLGPTADQIVAAAISGGTPRKSTSLRVQVVPGAELNHMALSWGLDGVRIDPILNPSQVFQTLFGNFMPSMPPMSQGPDVNTRRKAILDLVLGDSKRLLARVGQSDRMQLEKYFAEISALEAGISGIPSGTTAQCNPSLLSVPNSPVVDGSAYNGEEERAQFMVDSVAMAFACDITRVATVVLTNTCQGALDMGPLIGTSSITAHDLTHFPGTGTNRAVSLAKGVAWHVRQLARLVTKLRNIPETDGSSVLDHTAIVMVFEGAADEMVGYAHRTEAMPVLIAGRAGGLKGGQHILGNGRHPAQVLLSAMNAVGVAGPLGAITKNISELGV